MTDLMEIDAKSVRMVPAVVRAASILDELVSGKPKGVSELARALKLPKSSIHGICQTLADLGVLSRAGENRYAIGPHVLRWSNAFQQQSSLTREFDQLCETMDLLQNEALNLSVLNGSTVMYVACKRGTRPLGVSFSVGMAFPAAFTATGKAMMSSMTGEEVDAVLSDGLPTPITARSITTRAQLEDELKTARDRGYSMEEGQLREGMCCLGAPIFAAHSKSAIAGLAVGFLSAEAEPRHVDKLARDLVSFSSELSGRLGGRVPRY